VFLDETGVNLAMVRWYGRALKGQRAYGDRPKNHGKNVTLMGAMAMSGIIASFSFDGATNGNIFLFFIEEVLCPSLLCLHPPAF
ncbi:MAG: IS630 family transposase, partial [Cyanothece sp. SIO1E1]|nr:IS630 family transposase [Cyanothece sp. SIO1E1]